MPAELHSNGTARRVDRIHGEREYHDWSTLPRLQELWRLRQAQPSSASGTRLPQERAEIHRRNQLSDSNFVGHSADGKSKHTDGQVWGSLLWLKRLAIDVSVVNPTAVSHSARGAGACGESFLNPNAGTRAAEETKTKKYKFLCEQRGMDFVPTVFYCNASMISRSQHVTD